MLSKKKFQKMKNTTLAVFKSLLLFGKTQKRGLDVLLEYLKIDKIYIKYLFLLKKRINYYKGVFLCHQFLEKILIKGLR